MLWVKSNEEYVPYLVGDQFFLFSSLSTSSAFCCSPVPKATTVATITATANYGPEGRKRERESIRSFYFGQFGTLPSLPGLIWGSGLFIEVNSDVERPALPFSPHLIYRPDAVFTFYSVVQVFWSLIGGR